MILGIMKWLLFIFSFFLHFYEIMKDRNLLRTRKYEKIERVRNLSKSIAGAFLILNADIALAGT